jgi:hypothetical protein
MLGFGETELCPATVLPEEPAPEDAYLTVKLEVAPESVKADGEASTVDPETMVISAACHFAPSIGPGVPLIVAVALAKVTGPKLANGKTPPELDDGASTIHSADDLAT